MSERATLYRAPVLWLLLPYLGGLVLGRVLGLQQGLGVWAGGAVLAAAGALALRRYLALWGVCLVTASFLTGVVRYSVSRARLEIWDHLPARELTLELKVERSFAIKNPSQGPSGIGRVVASNDPSAELVGQRVYFQLRPSRALRELPAGATVQAVGVVRALPRTAAPTTFEGYLTSAGCNFEMKSGRRVEVLVPPGAYARFCQSALVRLTRLLDAGISHRPELTAVYEAMLLGWTRDLSKEQSLEFQRSGTMHLFSVSGLHIGVVAMALHTVLSLARLEGRTRLAAVLGLLWLYVDITGSSPAAVRSFWMVALVEVASTFRLRINPLATLGFAAWLVLWLDPMQLFSASFQMSFGIVAALLLWGGPLSEFVVERGAPFQWLHKVLWTRWHRAVDAGFRYLAPALCLAVATAPVSEICTVLYFNVITPGALLANLVMIPASSLVIVAGFLSIGCGLMGLTFLSSWFNHAAALVLLWMETALRAFVGVRATYHAAAFRSPEAGFGCLGLMLAVLVVGYARRWKPGWVLGVPALVAAGIFWLAVSYG